MDNSDFRTIQSIGRSELIKELTEVSELSHTEVIKGIGDDAAVTDLENDRASLFSSETFMEGVDFDLTYTPLHHLGFKMLSATVSDIYAMNGSPHIALVNLAVPNKLSVDMLKEIYKGIYAAGDDYNVQIVGGDLTASHATLSVSITCIGNVNKEHIVYRSGAKEGDGVCLSGDLGGAIAGLRILMREKQYWQENENHEQNFQPELKGYEYVVKRQLLPVARKDVTRIFQSNELVPTAMIDITQGLISELKQLTDASDVGAKIYQAALPIAPKTREVADEMQEDVDKYALYGGEDLELMFTMPEENINELSEVFDDVNVIGKITASGEGLEMQSADGDLIKFEEK